MPDLNSCALLSSALATNGMLMEGYGPVAAAMGAAAFINFKGDSDFTGTAKGYRLAGK